MVRSWQPWPVGYNQFRRRWQGNCNYHELDTLHENHNTAHLLDVFQEWVGVLEWDEVYNQRCDGADEEEENKTTRKKSPSQERHQKWPIDKKHSLIDLSLRELQRWSNDSPLRSNSNVNKTETIFKEEKELLTMIEAVPKTSVAGQMKPSFWCLVHISLMKRRGWYLHLGTRMIRKLNKCPGLTEYS